MFIVAKKCADLSIQGGLGIGYAVGQFRGGILIKIKMQEFASCLILC